MIQQLGWLSMHRVEVDVTLFWAYKWRRFDKFGSNSDLVHSGDYYFTRHHARYAPQQATEKLMLCHKYPSISLKFVYSCEPYLEIKSVCGVGMVEALKPVKRLPGATRI